MMELAEFLLARIAEDEEEAAELTETGRWRATRNEPDPGVGRQMRGVGAPGLVTTGYVGNSDSGPLAAHMARWDPARVLAECEAKRRIVARPWTDGEPVGDGESDWLYGIHAAAHHKVLRLLALPYRDHPDYRSEWAP